VRADDEANVIAAGLEIGTDGEKRFFSQPCPRFSCGVCSIYSDRPQVCRRYRCALLKSLDAGGINEANARERIATAMELIASVRMIDPAAVTPAARTALARRLTVELSEAEGPDRQLKAKLLLDTAVLEHFLNRWFLSEEDKPCSSSETVREES
jgi:hypothetical protein